MSSELGVPDASRDFSSDEQTAVLVAASNAGPVLVDFDETLYLRNSTHEFIGAARPAIVVYFIYQLLEFIRPWRWTGGESTRDSWRVRSIMILLPWSWPVWRLTARRRARESFNQPLLDALAESSGRVIVTTLGFGPVVRPLLAASVGRTFELIAMNPFRSRDRRLGKLDITSERVGDEVVGSSLVITDSVVDVDLLEAGAKGLLVEWDSAQTERLFRTLYFPGRYLSVVKRPNTPYIRRIIIREDFALWLFATVGLAEFVVPHVVGIALLTWSFWACYEAGYIDNDHVGESFEDDPSLTDAFRDKRLVVPLWKPAIAAILIGIVGIFVLRLPERPVPIDFALWALVLTLTTSIYALYNRVDKDSRVFLYPFLQLLRVGAIVALCPILPIAALALTIQALIRWVGYFVYRSRSGEWKGTDLSLIRLVFFLLGSVLLESANEWSELVSTTALCLLAWHVFLARRSLIAVVQQASRIDRPSRPLN